MDAPARLAGEGSADMSSSREDGVFVWKFRLFVSVLSLE
jgi:hypothetical protein